jgi:hypothetical protein
MFRRMARLTPLLSIATVIVGAAAAVPLFAYCDAACWAQVNAHQQRVNAQHQQQHQQEQERIARDMQEAAAAAPPTPPVPGYKVYRKWGALAYSPSHGVWWQSSNWLKKNEAGKSALSHCSAQGGGTCQLMITYSNQCAAVARATDNGRHLPGMDSVNTGSSREEAQGNAIRSCGIDWGKSCSIIISSCSVNEVQRVN